MGAGGIPGGGISGISCAFNSASNACWFSMSLIRDGGNPRASSSTFCGTWSSCASASFASSCPMFTFSRIFSVEMDTRMRTFFGSFCHSIWTDFIVAFGNFTFTLRGSV